MDHIVISERNNAVKLLSDTEALVLLSSYAEQCRSIRDASLACSIGYQKAYYLTKKLLILGLVESSVRSSSKRKRYEAVSRRIIITSEASPFDSLETMVLEMGNFRNLCAYSASMLKEKSERYEIVLDVGVEDGGSYGYYVYFMPETPPSEQPFEYSSPFFGIGDTWMLSAEQARALEDDLRAIVEKYQDQSETWSADESEEFYIQLGMVRVRSELRKSIRYKHHKSINVE